MSRLVFQDLEIIPRPPQRKIPTAGLPVPPGPAVRVSERTQWNLIRSPLSGAVNQHLDVLDPRLQASIPPLGGALVRVAYHESKRPGADGKPEQRVAAVEILGTGRVPSLVVFIFLPNAPRIKRAPRGWVSKAQYLWATRP